MKGKGLIICIIFTMFSITIFAQHTATTEASQIEWLSFEEVEEKMKLEEKKMIVDIYRGGCEWCRKMERETFQEPSIINYINDHFYAVKLDAGKQGSITFQGETYEFVKKGKHGHHELAVKITRGEQGLPSIVFLDESLNVIQNFSGYKDPIDLEKLMRYFAEDHHRKTPWEYYDADFQPRLKLNAASAKPSKD